jgi:hypothetical protein
MDSISTPEPTFEENVQAVLGDLPLPVRQFLSSPERDAVVMRLASKYGLHTDQTGQVQRVFLLMLMGISSPDELATELTGMGLPPETVTGLLGDINTEVLQRLRIQEERASAPAPVSVPPAAPPVIAAPVPPPPAPTPVFTPPPAPPPVVVPSPVTPAPPVPEHPPMRTMASDMQAVKEHRMPEPLIASVPPPPAPAPAPVVVAAPEPIPTPPPARPVPPPPANLPGAPVDTYNTDPYREPVE